MEKTFASIIVDITTDALNKPFLYVIPEELFGKIKVGDKVVFPFGKSSADKEGYVLEILTFEELKEKKFYKKDAYFKKEDAIESLKEIKSIAGDKIAIKQTLFKIAIFLCREYSAPLQNCIKTVMPVKRVVRKNVKQTDAISKYKIDIKTGDEKDITLTSEQTTVINDILTE